MLEKTAEKPPVFVVPEDQTAAESNAASVQESSRIISSLGRKMAKGGGILTATVVVTGYLSSNIAEGRVGLDYDMPDQLPSAVAVHVGNAVSLSGAIPGKETLTENGSIKYGNWRGLRLSGVSLGDGFFLSAGHALRDHKNMPFSSLECGNYAVSGLTDQGKPYTVEPFQSTAVKKEGFDEDFSLFRITSSKLAELTRQGQAPTKQPLAIAAKPLRRGDKAYFVNWEPTAAGELRDPTNPDPALETPAIYAGVVGKVENNTAEVFTDLKDYGTGRPDKKGREGSSGGLVLNEAGELVGISNGSQVLNRLWRALATKIGPFGSPGESKTFATVSLVDKKRIETLKQQIVNSESCVRIEPF